MKKLLLGVLLFALCFSLTGCGDKEEEELIDDLSDNVNENTSGKTGDEELKLYSDDTKMVFEYANVKHVFYYTGDTVTAYHAYIEYASESTAKAADQVLSMDDLNNVKKHYTKGKYVVLEYEEEEYADLKPSELKLAYSYMKEVTK